MEYCKGYLNSYRTKRICNSPGPQYNPHCPFTSYHLVQVVAAARYTASLTNPDNRLSIPDVKVDIYLR